MPRSVRDDIATLRLLLRQAERIAALSAMQPGGARTELTIELKDEALTSRLEEPGHEPMAALITDVRHFDSLRDDLDLHHLWEIIERRGVPDGYERGLAEAKTDYQRYQDGPVDIHIKHPDEDRMLTGRELFELWAYGNVLHLDLDKEQLLERLGPIGRTLARQAAHDYLNMLVSQVAFVSNIVRDGYGFAASG